MPKLGFSRRGSTYSFPRDDDYADNGTVLYSLKSEDGLVNREHQLTSRELRWEAFRQGELRNADGTFKDVSMQAHRLSNMEWRMRQGWEIITLGGILSLAFDTTMAKASWVAMLLIASLVSNFRDMVIDFWDDTPDPTRPEHHWAGTLIIILMFITVIHIVTGLQWLYETQCPGRGKSLHRLRRARFGELEAKLRKLDPYSRSFAKWYNWVKDDPDIALTVYRSIPGDELPSWPDQPHEASLAITIPILNNHS